jgi:class 3 adenylate cyclase
MAKMADPSGPGAPLARPAAGPDDLVRFQHHEAEHLARRWRVIAPLAIVLVALSEVAAYLTPEFPKDTFQSVSMILVLIGVWFAATRNPSRRVMGIITVLVSVTGSTFSAGAAAHSGGFASLQVMIIPCIFALSTSLMAMTMIEVSLIVVLSILAWLGMVFSLAPAPVDTRGLTVALTYLIFSGAIAAIWVALNRQLRLGEFVARFRLEQIHRFAVEEVLCRHLPPRYVEKVLAGTHLLDGPPERRVVTVVFADIVSFTPLSDSLPAEDLARIMARFYDVTSTIAFENHATIDKFIGDAVMAIMGAPEEMSPAEQARRALAMARAWQRAVRELVPGGRELVLRIGIHQDAVAVGSFGGRHRTDYTVLGMGVNIAARLEGACPPGLILVSREVYEQLDPRPAARHMGPLELKGVPRPVAAYAVEKDAA